MSNNKIFEFYKRAIEEQKFDQDFLTTLKTISSEEELKNFIETKLLPIATNMGYNFTTEELMSYEKENIKKISEEDLALISGGINTKHLINASSIRHKILIDAKIIKFEQRDPIQIGPHS